MAEEKNPFTGMSFGRAVDKLRRSNFELAPQFDEVFKDEEDFDTLERARLHQVESFYRGTIQGAATLNGLSSMVEQGPPKVSQAENTPAEEARQQWADNLRGKFRVKGKRDNPQQVWEKQKERYDAILDDLANYERMSDAIGISSTAAMDLGTTDPAAAMEQILARPDRTPEQAQSDLARMGAAVYGAVSGSIPTPENLVSFPLKGASMLGRVLWGGAQNAAVNVAVDPVVQAINVNSQVQKEQDWVQTILAAPIGFVVGGGLAGAGEVVSKSLLKRNMGDLAVTDPSIRSERFGIGEQGDEVIDYSRLQGEDGTAVARRTPEEVTTREPEAKPVPETQFEEPDLTKGIVDDDGNLTDLPPKPKWTKVGDQMGSNPGGVYKDPEGLDWYVKKPLSPAHLSEELAANNLYALTGANVPSVKSIDMDGVNHSASKMLGPEYKKLGELDEKSPEYAAAVAKLKEDFAADAWLANHDVIGLTKDNVLVNPTTGEVVRLDQGGALDYRAQGQPKIGFGDVVEEFISMRDPKVAKEAGAIFKDMTTEELIASLQKVTKLTDKEINEAVFSNSTQDYFTDYALAKKLMKRRDYLKNIEDSLVLINVPGVKDKKTAAKALGFKVDPGDGPAGGVWYHGTSKDFSAFDLTKSKTEKAVFLSQDKKIAKAFAGYGDGPKSIILELYHRADKIKIIDPPGGEFQSYSHYKFAQAIDAARKAGYDAVLFKNVGDSGGIGDQLAILKPSKLRSIHAAFDPKKKASKQLAALMPEGEKPKPSAFDEGPTTKTEGKTEEGDFDKELEEFYKLTKDDEMAEARHLVEQGKIAAAAKLPNQPIPKPDTDKPPEVVFSLQQMVAKLEDRLGIPIRQGNVEIKGAAGTYNYDTGVIHIKEYPDFSVASHEVGHGIHAIVGKDMDDFISNNAAELRTIDYDQSILGQRPEEGFAEFIRYYLTHPGYVQTHTPAAYGNFNNLLEQKAPELLKDLIDFQIMFSNYLKASTGQKLSAGTVTPTKSWADKFVEMLTGAQVAPTPRNVVTGFYASMVNENHELPKAVRAMGKAIMEATGKLVDVLPSQDPRELFRKYMKATHIASSQLTDGIIPWGGVRGEGPSLTQALELAIKKTWGTGKWDKQNYSDFVEYLKARRGVGLWDRFEANELPNPPLDVSKVDLEIHIGELEAKYPTFREASDMVNQFNRNLLKKMVDSGAFYGLDRAAMERILASEAFYVPFNRDMSDKAFVGKQGNNAGKGVQQMKGSMRDIIDPLAAMMNNLMKAEQQMAHAELMRSLASFAKRAGVHGGKFLEMVDPRQLEKIEFDLKGAFEGALKRELGYDPGKADNATERVFSGLFGDDAVTGVTFRSMVIDGQRQPIVFWNDEGKLQAARVSTREEGYGIYELVSAAPKQTTDLFVEMLSTGGHLLVKGVTTDPIYAMWNVFRDQFTTAFYAKGYVPFYSAIKGARHYAKDDEFAQAYRNFGGVNPAGAIVPAYADAVEKDIQALAKQGFGVHKVLTMKGLVDIISASEAATRLGALEVLYKQKRKMGLSEYDSWISAVNETSDLLPFDRYGSAMQSARKIVPFLNPYIQSIDKLHRSGSIPLKRAIADLTGLGDGKIFESDVYEAQKAKWLAGTFGAASFAFGATFAMMNSGKSQYEDASGKVLGMNFVVPHGDDQVILLKKPWEMSLPFTAGEMAWRRFMRDDPRAAAHMLEAAKETLYPPNLLWGNPYIGTFAGMVSNYNHFTKTPIESGKMQEVEPWLRFDERSGAISKTVGRITGWSPKKIDFMLSGLGGNHGTTLAKLGAGNADDSLVGNLEDMTLARAGLRSAAQVSDAREKFWKHMGRTTGDFAMALSSYNMLNSAPQTQTQAMDYYKSLSNPRKAWVALFAAADENGKAVFTADDHRAHPLQRAVDAQGILSKMQKAVAMNVATDDEDKSALVVNPEKRKKVAQILGTMAVAEMSNALKIIGEPGYAGRTIIDMDTYMEQLKVLEPRIAQEVADRYATKKVYTTEAVAKVYKQMEIELVRGGSNADLQLTTHDVVSGGYEFGADRKKKTPLRRTQIPGG